MPTDTHLEQLVHVDALENHLLLLSDKDQVFAASLITGFKKYKKLSAAQIAWVIKLTLRAQGFDEPAWRKVPGFDPLRIYLIGEKIKSTRHKFELQTEVGKVVLVAAGMKAKYPGSVSVTNGGEYGVDQVWYGYIDTDGNLNMRTNLAETLTTAVVQALQDVSVCFA